MAKRKRGKYPPKGATAAAFREVTENEPGIVGKTRKKKGATAARKQKVAIALSKARRATRKRYKAT